MKILITGGSGFVGDFLSRYLVERDHRVIATGMRPRHSLERDDRFAYVSADTAVPGPWQDHVGEVDAIINLAGKNIFRYWTDTVKRRILESRILTTQNLVMALGKNQNASLLNASAIGYYGDRGEAFLEEASPAGNGFLAGVSVEWEKEALQAQTRGARVVLLRFSVVLGKEGGALAKMLPAYKFFAGGPMGSGMQWLSWVHIHDLAAAVELILANEDMTGPYNCCSPHPVRNHDFAKSLGKVLGRPVFLKTPAFLIKRVLGEMGSVMLSSQRCVPKRLQRHGFEFQYPVLEDALRELLNEKNE